MNPTRPIDTKKPVVATGARGVAGASPVPHASGAAGAQRAGLGETVELSSAARAGAEGHKEIDAERMQALRQAVADGSYQIDVHALAKRIVEDALGQEATE